MKIGKMIGRAAVGALVLALTPYRIEIGTEDGGFEAEALLYSLKKTVYNGKTAQIVTILPRVNREAKLTKADAALAKAFEKVEEARAQAASGKAEAPKEA